MNSFRRLILVLCIALAGCGSRYDVVVIGGGASGTAAALQAARDGRSVLLVEQSPWLGGMLTSAGVSAVDGNYNIRGGIFGEFCDSLAARYGGYDSLNTGWVSNIQFEPHVGKEVFENMVRTEEGITCRFCTDFTDAVQTADGWKVTLDDGKRQSTVCGRILVDATELGDVAKAVGVNYRIGMESSEQTGEAAAVFGPNDVIQDLTYVAILKDYGPSADMTIERPENYDREKYVNCCLNPLNNGDREKGQTLWSADMMLTYGKLPGGKYMINWPIEGNDYYANVIDSTASVRLSEYELAKQCTLGFIYFIQTELGMSNLGLADDEFPTGDLLPFYPYNRESRRIDGESFFVVEAAAEPYSFKTPIYRTGIAVGDYAVDHHHFRHPDWRNLPKHIFAPILAFSVPMGCIVPKGTDNLIVVEKSISVSNLMNGTTRLQPVVMELGQAAGELASQAVEGSIVPRKVGIRSVQAALLESGCYIMPYRDVPLGHPSFVPLQKIGACGILRSTGEYVDWQNRCYIRSCDKLKCSDLYLEEIYGIPYDPSDEFVTFSYLKEAVAKAGGDTRVFDGIDGNSVPTRAEAAGIIDSVLHPFESYEVDFDGNIIK